jgi:hypothetical protein
MIARQPRRTGAVVVAVGVVLATLAITTPTPVSAGGEEYMTWGIAVAPVVYPEPGGTCLVYAKIWLTETGDSKVNQLKAKFHLLSPYVGTSDAPDWAKGVLALQSEGWGKVDIDDDANSYVAYFAVRFRIPEGIREYKMQGVFKGGRSGLFNTDAKHSHTFDEVLTCDAPVDATSDGGGTMTMDPDRQPTPKPPTGVTPDAPTPTDNPVGMGGF